MPCFQLVEVLKFGVFALLISGTELASINDLSVNSLNMVWNVGLILLGRYKSLYKPRFSMWEKHKYRIQVPLKTDHNLLFYQYIFSNCLNSLSPDGLSFCSKFQITVMTPLLASYISLMTNLSLMELAGYGLNSTKDGYGLNMFTEE